MIKVPDFGRILPWRVVYAGEEHTAAYNGHDWTIRYLSRRGAEQCDRPAGWSLDLTPEWDGHPCDPDRPWPDGYPLGHRVDEAHYVAELRLFCPWLLPTVTADAPSLITTLLMGGTGWDTPQGAVSLWPDRRRTGPSTRISIRRGGEHGEELAVVRPVFRVPEEPALESVTVRWAVIRPGRGDMDLSAWHQAFVEAIR